MVVVKSKMEDGIVVKEAVDNLPVPKGVVYVASGSGDGGGGDGTTSFLPRLAHAIGYHPPAVDVFGFFERIFGGGDKEREQHGSWKIVRNRLERCARRYNVKHRRGVMLIIDDADAIARAEEPLFRELQQLAKDGCDEGLIRVVFMVSNDGAAMQSLQQSSAWNRAIVYNSQ